LWFWHCRLTLETPRGRVGRGFKGVLNILGRPTVESENDPRFKAPRHGKPKKAKNRTVFFLAKHGPKN